MQFNWNDWISHLLWQNSCYLNSGKTKTLKFNVNAYAYVSHEFEFHMVLADVTFFWCKI